MRPLVALLLPLLPWVASCRAATPGYVDMPPPYEKGGVRVELLGILRSTVKVFGLHGSVTNTTSEELRPCTLKFEALDSMGQRVARAVAEIGALAPGEQRSFKARFLEKNVVSVHTVMAGRVTFD